MDDPVTPPRAKSADADAEVKRVIRELGSSRVRSYSSTNQISALAHVVLENQREIRGLKADLENMHKSYARLRERFDALKVAVEVLAELFTRHANHN